MPLFNDYLVRARVSRTFKYILMIKCDFDLFWARFARAGADITQTFTYYSRDVGVPEGCTLTCQQINQVRFFLSRNKFSFWIPGELWHCLQSCKRKGNDCRGWDCPDRCLQTCQGFQGKTFLNSTHQDKPEGKAEVQKELEEGLEVLIQNNIDLIIVEVSLRTLF